MVICHLYTFYGKVSFQICVLFFLMWVNFYLVELWEFFIHSKTKVLCQIYTVIISPFFVSYFHLIHSLPWRTNVLILINFSLPFFYNPWFLHPIYEMFTYINTQIFSHIFSSRNFIIFVFIFRSMIQFELILCMKWGDGHFFPYRYSVDSGDPAPFLQKTFLPHWIALAFLL